ncbi:hypothetical protein NST63_27525 [Heyndrickxia sp. FSL W8-0496]|uniref:hypothetical protein n=1 Tax=Heyndrickxia sp. FSL W8-0496 TaxID=2954702 RepID=UPI0030F9C50A
MKCCMCSRPSKDMVIRKNGDSFCKECHENNCEHNQTETIPVANGWETVTICHDCGNEI